MKSKVPAPPALPRRLSLVAQTAQSLRDGIQSGRWRGHLPGERELCAHLQVSRPTLRAALAELQRKGWLGVSDRRRRRIKARPANAGRAPRNNVAILAPHTFLAMPPAVMFVIDALRQQLAELGYATEFHVNRASFSAHPARVLEKLVRQHPASVWVACGSKEPMQRWFLRRQLPCVVMGSCAPGIPIPSVDADFRATCRHAGGILLRKGHRQLALVLPRDAYGGDVNSEDGLREALAATRETAGLRVLRHDGTTAHLCALLDEVLRLPNAPTAFLVARAVNALTVLMHLARRRQRIPQDIAVIARDDDPILQSAVPVVARYTINPAQLARRLAAAVRQLAEGGAPPARATRLMPKFLPGETV
ncbi:MAG: substrate-binding domain-containing protein [Verrucomicrobia bacterium]|nr:substrate-binding domain-containing protein [Verrucomicrobiota bacterium]